MIVDSNVYWLPRELFRDHDILSYFLKCVNLDNEAKAYAKKQKNGSIVIKIEKPIGQVSLDYFEKDYLLSKQLADMDEGHVDVAILKLPGCQEWIDLKLCKIFNRALAKHIEKSKHRLFGLAVVPPYATEDNIAELHYAINILGLKGIQLSTHYKYGYLDNIKYRDFLRIVSKMNIPVYVHHSPVPIEYNSIKEYDNLRRSYGRCEDQIISISREVYSNLFEELPNLKLIHSMLGGGYFTYKNMLLPHDSGNGRFSINNSEIEKRLEHNIYYEISHAQPWGEDNLEIATKILGDKNIIYGSSYPVKKVWMTKGTEMIKNLKIPCNSKKRILELNAIKLYNLK